MAAKKAKTKVTKKAAPTKRASPTPKPNAAFMRPLTPSAALAAVIGTDQPMPRTQATSLLWGYIKKRGLQDKANRRMINADDALRPIFGKKQISMFEMVKCLQSHLA